MTNSCLSGKSFVVRSDSEHRILPHKIQRQNRRDHFAVTPVSYPFRWLLLSSKHCFLCRSSCHSKKYNNALFCLTPHQSALRLTASPQGEALGWCTPQAFPSRGRCRASARRMRWRRGQVKDRGNFLAEAAPRAIFLYVPILLVAAAEEPVEYAAASVTAGVVVAFGQLIRNAFTLRILTGTL